MYYMYAMHMYAHIGYMRPCTLQYIGDIGDCSKSSSSQGDSEGTHMQEAFFLVYLHLLFFVVFLFRTFEDLCFTPLPLVLVQTKMQCAKIKVK